MRSPGSNCLLFALAAGLVLSAAAAPPRDDGRELRAAMANLVEAVGASAAGVQRDPFFQGDADAAGGAAYWTHMLIRTLEEEIIGDPDHPLFRVVDFRTREGGDNPDQRYLVSRIRAGASYRIWGRSGSQRRIEVQVYAGLPWSAEGGKLVAALNSEQIRYSDDGSFEVRLSSQRQPGNWLENPPAATAELTVMVRQIFSEWRAELPGDIHIDRIGYEGALKPPVSSAEMVERLNRAAAGIRSVVPLWPAFVRKQYLDRMPANQLTPPFDPGALGGVKGRWMSVGHFELADDEALILTTRATPAQYQGVQLTDLWFSSLEYANRQTSLTADQAFRSDDGRYQMVIAPRDPGVQNWLDTTGLHRGVILLRYDGLQGKPLPQEAWPTLRKIKRSELYTALAADTPAYDEAQRGEAIAARRRHVQLRFGI